MITMKEVSFRYKNRQPVLENLTLEMKPGGVYGILGANGVGKTTLLHLMNGLLFPKSGSVRVEGYTPQRREPAFLEQVFYVPVAFDLPAISVGAYRKRYADFYPKFSGAVWDNALRMFGIQPTMRLDALSFGQKKKVLLSFALASGCRLLLFDEPTDGLDIPSKDIFRRLLSAQIDEERLAIITTHHVHDISLLIDHLIVLKAQSLLMHASVEELSGRFRTALVAHAPSEALYSERAPGGYHCLLPNTDGQEGTLDLELLFKALELHPEILQNKESHEQQI